MEKKADGCDIETDGMEERVELRKLALEKRKVALQEIQMGPIFSALELTGLSMTSHGWTTDNFKIADNWLKDEITLRHRSISKRATIETAVFQVREVTSAIASYSGGGQYR